MNSMQEVGRFVKREEVLLLAGVKKCVWGL
jgi:hypothetical protein